MNPNSQKNPNNQVPNRDQQPQPVMKKRVYNKTYLLRRMMLVRLSSKLLLRNLIYLNDVKHKQYMSYFDRDLPSIWKRSMQLMKTAVFNIMTEIDSKQDTLNIDLASLSSPSSQQIIIVDASYQRITSIRYQIV